MGQRTHIEWTDHTFNPWWGCTRVSRACTHCYAEAMARRWQVGWGPSSPPRELSEANWSLPLRWSRAAKRDGVRRRVFCASMADVFERRDNEHGLVLDRLRARLWDLVEQADGLDWQLLTKRPENIRNMVPSSWLDRWPAHVWVGTTVEDQAAADQRIPYLLEVPARVRFLSCEPLVESIDLRPHLAGGGIHWVIAGGESGPGSQPSLPDWFRAIRDQCAEAGVPFFFKQWGDWRGSNIKDDEGRVLVAREGKAQAGRVLDWRTHDDFPVGA